MTTQRLVWDWNDPSTVVERELIAAAERLSVGAWFLNPMYRLQAPKATADFFVAIRKRQAEWLRVLSRQFGCTNWRRKAAVARQPYERQLEFTGILLIDGQEIDPRTQRRLEIEAGLRPAVSRRPEAVVAIRARDWGGLKEMGRAELETQLREAPNDPVFVTPGITVMGMRADAAFYDEVTKRCSEWNRRLERELGTREKRRLLREVGTDTRMLVFTGCLAVDGSIFLPGCWPKYRRKKSALRRSPSGVPTVTPDYVGISLAVAAQNNRGQGDATRQAERPSPGPLSFDCPF